MSDNNLEYEKPRYAKYQKQKLGDRFGRPRPAPKPSSKKKRGRPSKEDKHD